MSTFRLALLAAVSCMAAVLSSSAATYYVWTNSPANGPGTNWQTAYRTIQSAIDAASSNDLVVVTNGLYDTGYGLSYYGSLKNRIAVRIPMTIRSVNGPGVTIIRGANFFAGEPQSIRCAYLADEAQLHGFTLTNGATLSLSASWGDDKKGGGVFCAGNSAIVSNCAIINNQASYAGGGIYGGRAYNSAIANNTASSDNGGGSLYCGLFNCHVISNSAFRGGGLSGGGAWNSLIAWNTAAYGGGAANASLLNCTVITNIATVNGGGCSDCPIVQNSIVWRNTAPGSQGSNYTNTTFAYSCATPSPGGAGNITNDPRLANSVAGDYRLTPASPCVNAGTNDEAIVGTTDLNDSPRIVGVLVDMGAYELQVDQANATTDSDGDGIPDRWETMHGLRPGSSNAPSSDADGDTFTDVQEFVTDTEPLDSSSTFKITGIRFGNDLTIEASPTSTGRLYTALGSTNLQDDSWLPIGTSVSGTGASNLFHPTGDNAFFRIQVEVP